ncbi:dynamin family protein [Janthinobacterium sp. PSPC3-1]
MATMSAGKSSFINALVGHELLPSGNEATTACVTSIEHCSRAKYFRGTSYSHDGIRIGMQKNASLEQVRSWNADEQVKHIRLSGKIGTGYSRRAARLVLHDTPGPNNSQDRRHAEVTLDALHTIPFKLLCYVLDAGQMGTLDDQQLLAQLREQLDRHSGHRLVFILNKIDLLDRERGELVSSHVEKARHYLEQCGFQQPIIVPTMSSLALYARKALNAQTLTRTEHSRLKHALDDLAVEQECLLHAAALPDALKSGVRRRQAKAGKAGNRSARQPPAGDLVALQQVVLRSGIRTVEFLLNQPNIAA